MASKMSVICFTDIQSSTVHTKELGNVIMNRFREQYLGLGRTFAAHTKGNYLSDAGDSHYIEFSSPEHALHFSMQLQQYYDKKSCFKTVPFRIRIGLNSGTVAVEEEGKAPSISGDVVNRTKGIETITRPGEIWVSRDFVDNLSDHWTKDEIRKYFDKIGRRKLKNSKSEMIFSFDWRTYAKDKPKHTLSQYVLDHLQEAMVERSNFEIEDMVEPSTIIWPVVPRDFVNAIHRGQIEIIRLLALVGWQVHILIADCGRKDIPNPSYTDKFRRSVQKYLTKRDIANVQISYMSKLYRPKSDGCHNIHEYFTRIINDITYDDLLKINRKRFSQKDAKQRIQNSGTIDFLRPLLTIVAVLSICNKIGKKCLVIAGRDEDAQWQTSHAVLDANKKYGVLFNPILEKKAHFHQSPQTKVWPHWFSAQEVHEAMKIANLASWLFKLHVYLPSFPSKDISIGGDNFSCKQWKSDKHFENKIDLKALSEYAYNNILRL